MLIEAKSNLARLMATENLVVEERNVQTAYFDPKNRILTVPILNGDLSSELYDLLLGHEVGHALETPPEGWHDSLVKHKVNKSILNVCEDARIEKKIKRRFPGLKPSFAKGYRELLEMDFFGIKGVDVNTLNFIDRVNLHTKGGAYHVISFSDEEKELLREIENTESFEEVVEVALKVQQYMKDLKDMEQKEKQDSKKGQKSDSAEEGEEEESESSDKSSTGSGEDDSENKIKPDELDDDSLEMKEVNKDGSSEIDEKGKGNKTKKSMEGGDGPESDISSVTDQKFREKEKSLYNNTNKSDIIYSNIPEYDSEKCIFSYKEILQIVEEENKNFVDNYTREKCYRPEEMMQSFVKYKNQSNKVVSYLVKEFEMRKNAEKQNRARTSKTGELNMDKIYEYKLTDDIFKRMTNVPNGKSHGLVMFVDWSGSMDEHLGPTVKQLFNLVMFCKKVNIPYEVYAFTSNGMENVPQSKRVRQKQKVGDLQVNFQFNLLNILSSKMTNKEFMKMASILYYIGCEKPRYGGIMIVPEILRLSGTPLNSAIVAAFDIVPKFKKNNRLQIVNTLFLTDGESSMLEGRISFQERESKRFVVLNENVPTTRRRCFYRDPVTKATVEVTYRNYSISGAETETLLKLLKQRVDSNLIGFYVARRRDINNAISMFCSDEKEANKLKLEFQKNDNTVITTYGYDEYYMLRSESLNTEDDEDFEVNSTTTRGLVSAFSKYTGGKTSSRVILNRFIKLIA
jgi:hypothetical protein